MTQDTIPGFNVDVPSIKYLYLRLKDKSCCTIRKDFNRTTATVNEYWVYPKTEEPVKGHVEMSLECAFKCLSKLKSEPLNVDMDTVTQLTIQLDDDYACDQWRICDDGDVYVKVCDCMWARDSWTTSVDNDKLSLELAFDYIDNAKRLRAKGKPWRESWQRYS